MGAEGYRLYASTVQGAMDEEVFDPGTEGGQPRTEYCIESNLAADCAPVWIHAHAYNAAGMSPPSPDLRYYGAPKIQFVTYDEDGLYRLTGDNFDPDPENLWVRVGFAADCIEATTGEQYFECTTATTFSRPPGEECSTIILPSMPGSVVLVSNRSALGGNAYSVFRVTLEAPTLVLRGTLDVQQ